MHTHIEKAYAKDNITLITVNNTDGDTFLLGSILTAIAEQNINIDMICSAPIVKQKVSVSFTIDDYDLHAALKVLGTYQKSVPGLYVNVTTGNCKILLYSKIMVDTPGVGAWAIRTLGDIPIKLITTSDCDISILIDGHNMDKACRLFGISA